MLSRSLVSLTLFLSLGMMIGCSGTLTPILPEDSDSTTPQTERNLSSASGRVMWGMWQIRIDAQTAEAEVIPLRTPQWHVNAITFLEKSGSSSIILRDIIINGGSVELNVGLQHPFIGLYQWSGFDAHGIFITDGSYNDFASDGDIYTSDSDEPQVLNLDGWTRWWNPSEFPLTGTILGYTDGLY